MFFDTKLFFFIRSQRMCIMLSSVLGSTIAMTVAAGKIKYGLDCSAIGACGKLFLTWYASYFWITIVGLICALIIVPAVILRVSDPTYEVRNKRTLTQTLYDNCTVYWCQVVTV